MAINGKDPVISIALRTHVTAALGGHETNGDVVFIEDNANTSETDKKVLEEVRSDLLEIFNKHAFTIAYNAIAFGDGYARTYYEKGKGLVGFVTDEMVHPTLIQPYEQGGQTVGFLAGSTSSFNPINDVTVSENVYGSFYDRSTSWNAIKII